MKSLPAADTCGHKHALSLLRPWTVNCELQWMNHRTVGLKLVVFHTWAREATIDCFLLGVSCSSSKLRNRKTLFAKRTPSKPRPRGSVAPCKVWSWSVAWFSSTAVTQSQAFSKYRYRYSVVLYAGTRIQTKCESPKLYALCICVHWCPPTWMSVAAAHCAQCSRCAPMMPVLTILLEMQGCCWMVFGPKSNV